MTTFTQWIDKLTPEEFSTLKEYYPSTFYYEQGFEEYEPLSETQIEYLTLLLNHSRRYKNES